jgi:hypothetical protein
VLRFGGAAGLALQIRDRWRDAPLRLSLLTLAGALLAHAGSARLLVERALPTEPGPRDAALSRLVTAAERKARQHARAARIAIGFVPMQARLRYEQALAVRPADRALALELLWTSSLYSQIAIALARNPGPGDRRALAHSADALGRPARECARPEGSAQ